MHIARLLSCSLTLGVVATALLGQGVAQAQPTLLLKAAASEPVTDRIIVKYRNASLVVTAPSNSALSIAQVAGNRQGVRLSHLRRMASGSDVIQVSRAMSVTQLRALAADLRSGDANVEYAEPDRILQPQATASDPMYAQQWAYFDATAGMNLPAAWDRSTGKNVVVAVLDTGVRAHADLKANLVAGYDFIADTKVSNDGTGRDADPTDPGDAVASGYCYSGSPASNSTWHGTHVAGSVGAAANNGVGVAGVAHGAKVQPVRVLGRCGGYTSDIADGIVWASGGTVAGVPANATPARVINLSLGGNGACDTTTQNAINAARSRGAVVVVAAGNENADVAAKTPASCAGVITVAAVGKTGGKASYSNFGSKVALAAPGGDGSYGILSTLNSGTSTPGSDNYAQYMGTSMATPHVSGVAALMLSVNSSLTPDAVASMLKSSVRAFPATCNGCGAGIVNAGAAVTAAAGGTSSTPTPTPTPSPMPAPGTTMSETESNNSFSTGNAIAGIPMTVNGTIGSTSDVDYFKLTIPAATKLTFTLKPNGSSNYDLAVYMSNGKLLVASRNGTGLTETIHVTNSGSTAVPVVLGVNRVAGLTGSTGTYVLGVAK
jgi:serine protease